MTQNNQLPPPPPPIDPRFLHLLSRWEAEVRPLEKQGWEAQKIAQEFAKLGLSSALLLNGGALLALPPLMQWLSHTGRVQVAHQAGWFLAGIISISLAIVLAYINWMLAKEQQYAQAIKRARELDHDYMQKLVAGDQQHMDAVKKNTRVTRWIICTQIAAFIFAVVGYGFFGYGAFQFIDLAATNAIVPENAETSGPPFFKATPPAQAAKTLPTLSERGVTSK